MYSLIIPSPHSSVHPMAPSPPSPPSPAPSLPPIHPSVLDSIGNTPLLYLREASEATGCTILGKAEWMNPGGSIKDRPAKAMIEDAIAQGTLKPGGRVIEGTAGNTGIGLALVANCYGMQCEIVMPDNQSEAKKTAIRGLGATLIEVPPKPYKDPGNFVRYSGRLAEQRRAEDAASADPRGVLWANQMDNPINRRAHQQTTAAEIWQQTEGKLDGFICAVGSGGTLSGIAAGLRSFNPSIAIGLADPMGAAMYAYYTRGVLESEGSSITEGIGQGRITANLTDLTVDHAYQIDDATALQWLYRMIAQEGLSLGTSSGINVAGAVAMAKTLGKGHTIVTVLCDASHYYAAKIFSPAFLRERGLPVAPWMA